MSIDRWMDKEAVLHIYNGIFSLVQLLSHVWLYDPMNCSTPGLPVHHQLQWNIIPMEYYSAVKRNELESLVVMWMDLESVKKSKREKQTLYINSYAWNIERWYRWACLQARNRDTDIENKYVDTGGKGKKVRWTRRVWLRYIHYHV